MKIFFSASLHGKDKYQENYQKIVELTKKHGHKIIASHVVEQTTDSLNLQSDEDYDQFFKKMFLDLKRAEVIFIETSYSSTTTGFLLSTAVALNKPVVIFYSGKKESHIFRYLEDIHDRIMVIRYYDLSTLENDFLSVLDFVHDVQDTRFNFFVSPKIASFLDWIAKDKRLPRSVYLRRLIDQDMASNKEFLESR